MASDEILRVELLKREFATLSLIEAEDVLLLEWHARTPDNRLDPDGVAQLTECLEAAEKRAREGKTRGLIFSGGSRKHFSNGFDLSALGSLPTDQSRDGFVKAFAGLLSRILSLPLHTIGLVNGHAYGGGLALACAFDSLVMNSQRGWLCMPAVSLGITLPRGLVEVVRRRLSRSPQLLVEVMYHGQQLSAAEALSKGLVDRVAPRAMLLTEGLRMLPPSPLNPSSLGNMKRRLHHELLNHLQDPSMETPGIHSRL